MARDIERRERFTSIDAALDRVRNELERGRVVTISPSHDPAPFNGRLVPNGQYIVYPEKED